MTELEEMRREIEECWSEMDSIYCDNHEQLDQMYESMMAACSKDPTAGTVFIQKTMSLVMMELAYRNYRKEILSN